MITFKQTVNTLISRLSLIALLGGWNARGHSLPARNQEPPQPCHIREKAAD
jgi:hypothetical protein